MALVFALASTLLAGCGEYTVQPAAKSVAVQQLALGSDSSCLISDGVVYCWGEGDNGQLGDGLASDRLFPLPIAFGAGNTRFVALSLGQSHGCASRFTGALYCWGEGLSGALGNGTTTSAPIPMAVESFNGEDRKVRLFDAGLYHSCAVTEENELYCWGYSGNGQIGTGDIDSGGAASSALTPKLVQTAMSDSGDEANDKQIVSIATGGYHSCLTYSDGSAACWGHAGYGQLGNECSFGSLSDNLCTTDRLTPTAVSYFDGSTPQRHASKIFAGAHHSCIVNARGQLFCFGRGRDGRLGINESGFSYSVPQHAGNIPAPIHSLALGEAHGCALLTTGAVYCFGNNHNGQLGNGTTTDSAIPVRITIEASNNATLVGIAAGTEHSCAWDDRGRYYCWGMNSSGQLGLGIQGGSRAHPERGVY